MEKYGVEQTKTTKTASAGNICKCGSEVKSHGPIKWCPRCGTKPWEDDGYTEDNEDDKVKQD